MTELQAAALISEMRGQTLPVFFFVSTTFHEILHKYIHGVLELRPTRILQARAGESELYKAHLHLYALHGPEYARAWRDVHDDPKLSAQLIEELQ